MIGIVDSNQKIVSNGLTLHLDAAQLRSYSGSGTTWTDLSGNSNNVTTVNSPTFTSSNGGYFSFNGSTQYANRASPVSTAITNISMCAWINPANLSQLGIAVHNGYETGNSGNGYSFGVGNGFGGSGNQLQAVFNGCCWRNTGYTFPSANTWYYVVYTIDTTTSKWYVNGVQTSVSFNNFLPSTPTNNFSIGGADPFCNCLRFNGSVSIVQFYNVELTNQQILQNYNAQKSRFGL